MRAKRLGCLTPAGLLAVLITLLVIGGSAVTQGGAMFSPGKLSALSGPALGGVQSHQELGGQCGACHTAPWDPQSMTARCLDCHTQIQADLQDPASLHGGLTKDPAQINCRDCHTEHHGPEGELTHVEIPNFPHDRTGFSLKAHTTQPNGEAFICGDCHIQKLGDLDLAVCTECHTRLEPGFAQEHPDFGLSAFASACLDCHDGIDSYGSSFDHADTLFPLTGLHAEAACLECHRGMGTIQALQETPQECVDCHLEDDAHAGQLGLNCGSCHTPEGWKPAEFDHSKTAFALVGEHANAACQDCHANRPYKGTPSDCFSCHEVDDTHQGELGADCATCHTPAGWKPSTFQHSRSDFALTGKHTDLACTACHTGGQYKGLPVTCAGCHTEDDAHQGELGSDCAACHTTAGWKPSTFDHGKSAFALTGAHQSLPCTACHSGGKFKGLPSSCYGCHAEDDAHGKRFGTDCAACHSTAAWKPATFDHNRSAFPLTGAHVPLACTACHKSSTFSGTPTACSACHAQPSFHAGLFLADCGACHNTSRWLPASYNGPHSFPMNHGDANSCRDCHTGSLSGWTCFTCHSQGEIDQEHREEGIGDYSNCLRCHADGREGDGDGGGDGDNGDDGGDDGDNGGDNGGENGDDGGDEDEGGD